MDEPSLEYAFTSASAPPLLRVVANSPQLRPPAEPVAFNGAFQRSSQNLRRAEDRPLRFRGRLAGEFRREVRDGGDADGATFVGRF